jgi:uncharacterized protein
MPEHKNKKIGFLGISMGAVTSLSTAGKTGTGDFIIASVPYISLNHLFHFQITHASLPIVPFFFFMKLAAMIEFGAQYDEFSPIRVIQNIRVPILLFSATHDEMVRSTDVQLLFQKANNPKQLWEADATHDIHRCLPKEFEKRVLDFLHGIL